MKNEDNSPTRRVKRQAITVPESHITGPPYQLFQSYSVLRQLNLSAVVRSQYSRAQM